MHCMKPQQSVEFVHLEPAPAQQRGTIGAGRQTEPLQQPPPPRMGTPSSRHEMLGPRQLEQVPNWQFCEPSQASGMESMFVSQHICMSRPQSSGVVVHVGVPVERSQIRPMSQVPRGVQGSPMPPVSVDRMHMPPGEQTRSPEHSVPPGRPIASQHRWSMSPHANAGSVTDTHRVPSHESRGELHAEAPSQQGWPMSPHAPQVPVVGLHTRPERQVKPAQQVPPAPPQPDMSPGPPGPGPSRSSVSGLRHTPLAQTSPVQQSVEPEQLPPRGEQHAPP
jgi:hypothetical protein